MRGVAEFCLENEVPEGQFIGLMDGQDIKIAMSLRGKKRFGWTFDPEDADL